MTTTQKDSTLTNVIKNLCHSYGWSYGVFWSFDQSNSILLTMQGAYFEDHMQYLIDDLLLQSPVFGGGLIGQAALTKKHIWMTSKDNFTGQNASGSIWDMFQDDSENFRQFSSGIETIAAIPVEPQGVVQFGSTNKIVENTEFINKTKRIFDQIVNGNAQMSLSSSPNGLYASLISPEDHYSINHTSIGLPHQSLSSGSQFQPVFLDQSTTNLQPYIGSTLTSFKEPHQDMFDISNDFGITDEIFQVGDFSIPQWYPQSPIETNMTLKDHLIFQDISFNEKVEPLSISCNDVGPFGNTGDLGDILTPVVKGNHVGYDLYNSGHTSASESTRSIDDDSSTLPPKQGLFNNLGIKELFEGITGTSTSCVDNQVSSCSKKWKTGNSMWETGSLQPAVYNKSYGQKSETIFKSEPWLGDGYSIDGSSTISQAMKQAEPKKSTKKKAKPGTRPRPKDRQMILDRMAELRELIPNGQKMSIDCLLDRTIKHMLFLQNVTKHADRIKHADEPKNNGVSQNDYLKDPSNNVTWACELGNQTMICPLIVEDLSTPGQMLIEMICEERGFFLEIVDIIRGFGLTIFKGNMEAREEKIWARFIVEAEAKRHVTRHEIFAALVQLLQTLGSNVNHLNEKIMQNKNSLLLNNFHHSEMQLPVCLTDTRYRGDL